MEAHFYEIEDMICFAEKHKPLYIYGCASNQEYLLKFLDFCDVKVDGYVVSYNTEQNLKYRKIPIELVEDAITREGVGIILGLSDIHYGQIIPWFRKKDFNDYFMLTEHSKNSIAIKMTPPPPDKMGIEVALTSHCNLNCQMCNVFSQLSPEQFLDVSSYERDMKRLSELFGHKLSYVVLFGGEPLLHREIIKIIEITRKEFPEVLINIITNGLLLQRLENSENGNLWQACKDNHIGFLVTRYPVNLDYNAIENLGKKYGVQLKISAIINSKVQILNKISTKSPLDLNGKQPIYGAVSCYGFNSCRTLKDGHLYTCHLIPSIDIFNNYFNQNLKVSEKDSIDIYKVKSFEEITEFMASPPPFCRYCDIKNQTWHSPWKRSSKKIEEYLKEAN
jgi:MoaA/NifB/PqqE/SkfB family radical SAM enzyme